MAIWRLLALCYVSSINKLGSQMHMKHGRYQLGEPKDGAGDGGFG